MYIVKNIQTRKAKPKSYEVEALLNECAVKLESVPDKDNTHFSHLAKVFVHTA
jgi:hypothetical protein